MRLYNFRLRTYSQPPIVFEAILFLHMNCVLWDERTVMEALAAVRANLKDEHLQMKLNLANDGDNNKESDVSCLEMYCTNVLLARLTKVRH